MSDEKTLMDIARRACGNLGKQARDASYYRENMADHKAAVHDAMASLVGLLDLLAQRVEKLEGRLRAKAGSRRPTKKGKATT